MEGSVDGNTRDSESLIAGSNPALPAMIENTYQYTTDYHVNLYKKWPFNIAIIQFHFVSKERSMVSFTKWGVKRMVRRWEEKYWEGFSDPNSY